MQPQIKSKVRCSDGVAGEVAHVIADPLALDLSHLVVRVNGTERQVPMTEVSKIQEDSVDLLCTSAQLAEFPIFASENLSNSPFHILYCSVDSVVRNRYVHALVIL